MWKGTNKTLLLVTSGRGFAGKDGCLLLVTCLLYLNFCFYKSVFHMYSSKHLELSELFQCTKKHLHLRIICMSMKDRTERNTIPDSFWHFQKIKIHYTDVLSFATSTPAILPF